MKGPIEIFFSYAHEDEGLMDDVRRQLVIFDRLGFIRKWHDRRIRPGDDWKNTIDQRLALSDIIVLFVSPHFFESDYCYEAEMKEAMRRHEAGVARVVPVILRPCAWQTAPFAALQALPTDARPVTSWANRDEACLDVAEGIMRAVGELREGEHIPASPVHAANGPVRIIAVRVHRAFFIGQPNECHFINITNLSPNRVVEVTHVWYEDEVHHIPVVQESRALPVRLDLDQSWETWIETARLPAAHRHDAALRFRARTSNGAIFKSVENLAVPPVGSVPGGPIF